MPRNSLLSLAFAIAFFIASPIGIWSITAGENGTPTESEVLLGEWTNGLFTGEIRTVDIGSWLPGSANTSGYYFGANGLLIHVYGGTDKAGLVAGRLTATYRVDGNRILLTDVTGSRRNVLDNAGVPADKPLPDAVKYFRIGKGGDGVPQLAIADRAEDLDMAVLYKKRKTAPGPSDPGLVLPREAEAIVGAWRYGIDAPEHAFGKSLDAYKGGKHHAAVHTFNPDGTYTHVYSGSGPKSTASGVETARYRVEGNRIVFTESFNEFYDPNFQEKSFRNRGYPDRAEFFDIHVNDKGESQLALERSEKDLRGPHPWYTRITDKPGAASSGAGSPPLAIEYPKAEELIGSWRRGTVNPDLPYDASLDRDKGYYGTISIFNPDGTWVRIVSSVTPVLKTGTRQTAKYCVDENRIFLTECREDKVDVKMPTHSYKNKPLPDTTLFFRMRTSDTGGRQISFSASELGLDRNPTWFDKDAEAKFVTR